MPPKLGTVLLSKRVFTQEDFDRFADLSGDDNPIHVDPGFASTTRFGSTVAHGMLLYGLICGMLSEHFYGSSQIQQRLMFVAPTFAGEEITTRGEVIEVSEDNKLFKVAITMTAVDGKEVCNGEASLRWRMT